jgi:hypothetical protein
MFENNVPEIIIPDIYRMSIGNLHLLEHADSPRYRGDNRRGFARGSPLSAERTDAPGRPGRGKHPGRESSEMT